LSKIGNLPLERSSLATEGTQEFPPLKKTVSRKYQFMPNILSLSDNASYKLAFIDGGCVKIGTSFFYIKAPTFSSQGFVMS
jgi:hypothetical protein